MSSEDFESESNSHGCCGRNKLSICLAIVVMFLVIALSFVSFLFVGFIRKSEDACREFACIRASAQISEFIDDTVDPCENFYSFVCGKFEEIAFEKQIDNLINAERERVLRHINTLIVEPSKPDDILPVKMQKSYFQACMKEDVIDEYGNQILLKKLSEVGEWPFLWRNNAIEENKFDWMQVMVKARDLGLPFQWFLKVDLFNDDNYELKLSHPENCGVYLTLEYFAMQRDILEQLTHPTLATISEFTYLEKFEKDLNSICANKSNSEITLRRMKHIRFDNVHTAYFLKSITGLMHMWKDDSLVAVNLEYISELNRLIKRTPKRVQANYILWKIVQYFIPYLPQSIRQRYAQYLEEISEPEVSRFDFCLADTKSRFKFVSELVQLRDYADPSLQENGKELVASLKDEVIAFIENTDWRNNKTKESHLNFYKDLEEIIGGPEEMFEDTFLNDQVPLGNLLFFFHHNNIMEMIIDLSRSNFAARMRMIGEPTTMDYDFVHEANSNFDVVLDSVEQTLVLPAYAFNSLLYDNELPQYLNYAGLGGLVSEELVKGLNMLSRGKHDTNRKFDATKKCLIENLQKYNKHLNASMVFLLNYESLLGQELTYKAYQKYVESNKEEIQLVNLPYSPNQLFWIKSSLNWCYHALPYDDNHQTDMHHLKYRILETVKNSESFAIDFNCSSETAMNPKNKCTLL